MSFACISNDAQFFALGQYAKLRTFKVNNGGTYDEVDSYTGLGGGFDCEFSDDNQFLFYSAQNPVVYKYDGSNFASHQTITATTQIIPQRVKFKNPYLIVPDKNGAGNVNIRFFQHNGGNDQWEQVTEVTYSDSNFFNFGISDDFQWLGKVSSV